MDCSVFEKATRLFRQTEPVPKTAERALLRGYREYKEAALATAQRISSAREAKVSTCAESLRQKKERADELYALERKREKAILAREARRDLEEIARIRGAMDFSEKDAMGWNEAPVGKQYPFDFSLLVPEFPFSGMPDNSQFFYVPEAEFPMLQQKREEDIEVTNPMFFYHPEMLYPMGEPPTATSDWNGDVQERPKGYALPVQMPKQRVPYPHAKKVGTISVEERRLKIERYLEKRSRRNYGKKVSYACRKRVADTRIRVKGRFVAKKIAEALKGMENEKNNVSLQPHK